MYIQIYIYIYIYKYTCTYRTIIERGTVYIGIAAAYDTSRIDHLKQFTHGSTLLQDLSRLEFHSSDFKPRTHQKPRCISRNLEYECRISRDETPTEHWITYDSVSSAPHYMHDFIDNSLLYKFCIDVTDHLTPNLLSVCIWNNLNIFTYLVRPTRKDFCLFDQAY